MYTSYQIAGLLRTPCRNSLFANLDPAVQIGKKENRESERNEKENATRLGEANLGVG